MSEWKQVSSSRSFKGHQKVFSHRSEALDCDMNVSVYVPPSVEYADSKKVGVIYWLSGLTCTEQNFITKSGFQRYAAEHNVCVVGPDTSPRAVKIDGEDDDWDFGSGAGFYVNASEEKWKKHYQMYSYVTQELPELVEKNLSFVEPGKRSICGHSMGGHGALICALKNPGMYLTATAFAPIANPMNGAWGRKAFSGYLGPDEESWKEWDATCLVSNYNGPPLNILIDQGSADEWLEKGELLPKNFVNACAAAKMPVIYRVQDGYDHGYFFVGTFLDDHFKHHAKYLYA